MSTCGWVWVVSYFSGHYTCHNLALAGVEKILHIKPTSETPGNNRCQSRCSHGFSVGHQSMPKIHPSRSLCFTRASLLVFPCVFLLLPTVSPSLTLLSHYEKLPNLLLHFLFNHCSCSHVFGTICFITCYKSDRPILTICMGPSATTCMKTNFCNSSCC